MRIKLKEDLVGLPKTLGLLKDCEFDVKEIHIDYWKRKSAIVIDATGHETPVFRFECVILERDPVPPVIGRQKYGKPNKITPPPRPSGTDRPQTTDRQYRLAGRS